MDSSRISLMAASNIPITMPTPNKLIIKLLGSGVVSKEWPDGIRFTHEFCLHVVVHSKHFRKKGSSIADWRKMFVKFNRSLVSLTDEEIANTIVLLDYFLQNLDAPSRTESGLRSVGSR